MARVLATFLVSGVRPKKVSGVRFQVSGFRLNVGASEKAPLFVEIP